MHYLPDPVLRQKAKRVSTVDNSIQRLIDDMLETMPQAGGVGLAAPQIGVSLRVIVLQMPDEEPVALINPEIVKRSGDSPSSHAFFGSPGIIKVNIRHTIPSKAVIAKRLRRIFLLCALIFSISG